MPKPLIIQTVVGFTICAIAMTLFVYSLLRIVISTEYHQITSDATLTLTPDHERAYYIAVRSEYEKSVPDLQAIYNNLVVTSDRTFGDFWIDEAPAHSTSGRTTMNSSTHTSSIARLSFTNEDPIMLTIKSNQPNPGDTLLLMSTIDLTVLGTITPFLLFLIGLGSGLAAAIRIFIWTIKKLTSNHPESPTPSAGAMQVTKSPACP
jgi:hypothetical protein